jgi:hypothetical protein
MDADRGCGVKSAWLAVSAVLAVGLAAAGCTSEGHCEQPGEGPGIAVAPGVANASYRILISQTFNVAAPTASPIAIIGPPNVLVLESSQTAGGRRYEHFRAKQQGNVSVRVGTQTLTQVAVTCRR